MTYFSQSTHTGRLALLALSPEQLDDLTAFNVCNMHNDRGDHFIEVGWEVPGLEFAPEELPAWIEDLFREAKAKDISYILAYP